GLSLYLGQVLHRDRARCAVAGGRLACRMVQDPDHRCHWSDLLHAGVAQNAAYAARGINNEKADPTTLQLSYSCSDPKRVQPDPTRQTSCGFSNSPGHPATAAFRLRFECECIEHSARSG